jgi:hypothetical protein
MMNQTVWRWLFGVGAVGAVGVLACGQGLANATTATPTGIAGLTGTQVLPATGAYKPPTKPLYVGETGSAVRNVQRRLNLLHYYAGPVDGVYGQDLLEAAWAFREVQGMPMNAKTAAEPISRTFEIALEHPKLPKVLVPKGGATRVEINQNIEVLVFYKDNKVDLILHTSTGGGYYFCNPGGGGCGTAKTPDGNYHAEYFIPGWEKVPLGEMYNPVYFYPAAGDAIHGDIPVPWYPASHGCVRIWMDAAAWFHKDLTVGGKHATPVYVRGKAPYQLQYFGQ